MEQAILQLLPADDFVIPKKVRHVKDDRGENFVVYFPRPVKCKDGVTRASVWLRCSELGHGRAKTAVLGYLVRSVQEPDPHAGGMGPVQERDDLVAYHGDPRNAEFTVHDVGPDWDGPSSWVPIQDTTPSSVEIMR